MSGVVIVGAGHAGLAAAQELKSQGYTGQVTLVDKSEFAPYERPPISKVWIAGDAPPDELMLRTAESLEESGIRLLRTEVESIDRERKVVHTGAGELGFDHLVLALGASPRPLRVPGRELEGVHSLHTIEQALRLRDDLAGARRLVVVGGGFIGLELASTLADRMEVSVVETADRLMARATSAITSAHMRGRHEALGIDFHFGATVDGFFGEHGRLEHVQVSQHSRIDADVAVLGIGVIPNGSWVEAAGLAFQDGIVVDEHLRTDDPSIYAIGDCARFPGVGGALIRLESVGNTGDHARRVAAAIIGAPSAVSDVPWFWTKQAGVRVQMVGFINLVEEWLVAGDSDSSAFSVVGLRDDRIVYGESINRAADHVALRKLLTAGSGRLTDRARARFSEGLRPALEELTAPAAA